MPNVMSKIKIGASQLTTEDQKMLAAWIERLNSGRVASEEDEPRTTTRRPRNSSRSATVREPVVKRSVGRPRKSSEEDVELTRPRRIANVRGAAASSSRGKSARDNAATSRRAPKPEPKKRAAVPAANIDLDFSDMSKSDLLAVADKWVIRDNKKLLRDPARLKRVLSGIQKLANSSKTTLGSVEKMAQRAKVELSFGKGRPPLTEEGLKRRVLAKMANEGAYNG